MEQEKVKYLINIINNMDIKDKLRLAICMSQSKWSGLIYNTKENYEKIEELFQNNLFIGNRWEYVRDEIREYLLRSLEQEER